MTMQALDGHTFIKMVLSGSHHLKNNSDRIDALNVFPVPDGDTGTNMNLSMTSGVNEVQKNTSNHISQIAESFSKGLLMGARGNSGVILSQIFRGFARGLGKKETVTTQDLAVAFDSGVQTAYKAVIKPVEGTILTVAKDAANQAVKMAKNEPDIITLMEKVLTEAKASLQRTPDLLPILKEVGVVDSGGEGLVIIYEGFLAALKGEELPEQDVTEKDMEEMINAEHHKITQDFMETADIEYGYCTEFMIKFESEKLKTHPFDEESFRSELSTYGDSLLVVADEEVIKVHVHVEYPGEVMTIGQRYGSLISTDIENMREQHIALVGETKQAPVKEIQDYAIVTVAMGSGIKELFKSLGASVIIEGGQTMNPSTQDVSNAITEANAKNIIIIPNNKNIHMAAEQAKEIAQENVEVVPTESIPQGISSLLAFNPELSIKENKEQMMNEFSHVKTGQVTYAVRDTKINGLTIDKGHFMGLADGQIKVTDQDKMKTAKLLLQELITEEDEILTILQGEDVTDEEAQELETYATETYDEKEVETHKGNQPIYSYIFSVE